MAERRADDGIEETGAPVDGGLAGADGKAGNPANEARRPSADEPDADEVSAESSSPLHLLRETLGRSDAPRD